MFGIDGNKGGNSGRSIDTCRVSKAISTDDSSKAESPHGQAVVDPDWDRFLESIPGGRYQQSAAWAVAKQTEGWSVERGMVRSKGRICGGFQLLWKKSRVGPLGYVSRGPIFEGNDPGLKERVFGLLAETIRELGLAMVIVQPPCQDEESERLLEREGFLPNRIQQVITATWVIPVTEGMEKVEAAMRKNIRNQYRQAIRRGVSVREGGFEDIGIFHELMKKTCQRQGVTPNPRSAQFLEQLWSKSSQGLKSRLIFAMYDGRPVSALFCLGFGRRLHLWKKGNDPEYLKLHPGEPLHFDALSWAHRNGYEVVDHEGMSRNAAESLLAKESLSKKVASSRDFYMMGYGGQPELLPEARVWIRSGALRHLYRGLACSKLGSRWLERFYVC